MMPMTENSEVENSFTKIKNTILSPSPPETTTFAGDANLPLSWQRLWRSFLGRDDMGWPASRGVTASANMEKKLNIEYIIIKFCG